MGRRGHCPSEHWREILRAIQWVYTYSDTNSDRDGHANSDPKSDAYGNPMHGEMSTDAEAAPHSRTASVVPQKS
jgi:hypothetical protein